MIIHFFLSPIRFLEYIYKYVYIRKKCEQSFFEDLFAQNQAKRYSEYPR